VQLAAKGIEKARLDQICAPAGVDVGAESPEEVAIAVAAELVAIRRGHGRPSDGLPIRAGRAPGPGGFAHKGRAGEGEGGGGRN
jgi:hypothetical protein